MGTLQIPSPGGLGFQVQKLIATDLKVKKKLFQCPPWAFSTRTTQMVDALFFFETKSQKQYNVCVKAASNNLPNLGIMRNRR